ncbi:hypothetical protein [Paraliomyxa miuraensis]|uniref:hypothetical protein n=1 Tax=Paraliomyxa miuraensis TaxID=376150 RepID=UPI00224FC6E2|nr:hypothetical protein [Paraliomyxa miuraensis]
MAMRSTNSSALLTTAAAALLGAFCLVGCDKGEEELELKGEAKEEEAGPPVQVSLPPPPNFDEGKAPEQWEDGAWSIWGLRRDVDKQVAEGDAGTEITLKGWVQEIYVPPECPEGGCPPPKQPHVWITDQEGVEGKKRAMMVVNYRFTIPEWQAKDWKDQPDVILEKGKRYTFKGVFKQFSDTGFASDHGLLEFKAYKPLDPETGAELPEWVYPPGASWHPLTIQQQEEQNAKLAEAAAKAAKK